MNSKLDTVQRLCDDYREKFRNFEEARPRPVGAKRQRIISVSDLHAPFCREDLLKAIIAKHSGADYCIVNGDLFDNYLISKFQKEREVPLIVEFRAASAIVRELSLHFGQVILIDGNHDAGRFASEMNKLNPTVHFLLKASPLKYLADGHRFGPSGNELDPIDLNNVIYAGDHNVSSWWYRIGQVIFCHRLHGAKKGPMANASWMHDWFIAKGTNFQCLVSGHTHRVGMVPGRNGRILIDQGCLCYPMEYETNGSCNYPPQELGYAVVDIDSKGNVDPETTQPIFLGTYQEP